ncbi:hypothetical protein MLD38_001368 [Melastoma candidum]|uniref:Uncharacterized protein n=1 Tax=Melastoma candidum TaxID=119954 RepID=A0ACB9SGB8_9MYRT|nr:hypothetical protein MLD38_001368 [Melastoma candidum]
MTWHLFLVPIATITLLGVHPFAARGGTVHHYDFIVKETEVTRLCETKPIMTVNDSFPGPVIRARRGDTVYVNMHNQGDYGLTLHWHGVRQPGNPWSDGPEHITQCAIKPSTNFTYEINFTEEEGTVWWHAHSDWTRATVHGAIVVLPAEGTTYPFPEPDGEEIIVLGSWYEGNLNQIVNDALAQGQIPPLSVSYLINGYPGDLAVACPIRQTYRWVVEYGKTYLIRLVTAVVDAEVFFAIARHNLTIVAMDGAYIKPIITPFITASPGRTMDILFTADQTPGLYYMATREHQSEDATVTGFDHSNATAILEYAGNYSSSVQPLFPGNLPVYRDFKASDIFLEQIRSLASKDHPVDVPLDITTRMFVVVSMNTMACNNDTCLRDEKVVSSLNNISWLDPPVDILKAYYWNISGIYGDFPDYPPTWYNFTADYFEESFSTTWKGTTVKVLNFNETVELIFQGTDLLLGSMNHPIHLHGQSFYVIGFGTGNFNNETDPLSFNLVDPPKLNTYSVPKNGWAAIRFRADNPGVWFFHCHLEHHQSWGMDGVFIVLNGTTEETSMRPPPPGMPSCPSWTTTIPIEFLDSNINDMTAKRLAQ